MQLQNLRLPLERLRAPLPMFRGVVDARQWQEAARAVAGQGRLVALWGADNAVHAAYALASGLYWLELEGKRYPDLASHFPFAGRMQRAAADLFGVLADGAVDTRPWLDHGAWKGSEAKDYPFVQVKGDGVHEIPVGPVHAGTIEPGHFRFSVVGEKVLRLEERLGYTHKGIEQRFTGLAPLEAHRLAGRVSGDSTVAYAWAYCMALESAAGVTIPARAAWLRALMLERERVANHLGDLGALGNDAALGFGLAQFSRLREDWLRASARAFGH
ncbi:MAG TPA: NADH-quinone oxidoreductase subunit C, partial [Burkholderiales bacterium]|nr:NADH-quinone oxidoreductase subunit C [Burkholderiales bacterium]